MPDNDQTPQTGTQDAGHEPEVREPSQQEGAREEPKAWEPDDNAKKWMTENLTRAQQEWEQKHLSPLKSQYDDLVGRMTKAELERLKAMGWIKDEPEKPLTRDEINRMFEEREVKSRENLYRGVINSGWRQVSKAHPELAKLQGFQRAVLAAFAENPNQDFADVAEAVVQDFEGYHSSKAKAAAEERERQMRPDRRMVPSGRGAAGGATAREGEKRTVGQKVLARLQEMRAK